MTEPESNLEAARASLAVAVRWDPDAGQRLGRQRARLARCMSSVATDDPLTASWTLSLTADDGRAGRRAVRAALGLGGQGLGTRVALSWRPADTAEVVEVVEVAAGPERRETALKAAQVLLERVRAANRHGTFADDQAHAHFGLPATRFGEYGWRLYSPERHTFHWLTGLVSLSLVAGAGTLYVPCLFADAESADARLWVGIEDGKGKRLKGCAIRAGDNVGLHLQARPAAYGSVVVLSPDGRWSVPHQGLADVVWSARAPEASGWFSVEAGTGQECLYAVSSPTPLGEGRGVEGHLNAAATALALPENAWLRPLFGAARLRSALAILAPGAEVFEATCALSYGR